MRLNKAKCRVLHMSWGNPWYQYRLGDEGIESREGLGGTDRRKAGHEPAVCARSPESQTCSGLHQEKRGQQVEVGDSASLLCSGEIPPGVLHPALDPPAPEGHGAVRVGPEEEHKNDLRAGVTLL